MAGLDKLKNYQDWANEITVVMCIKITTIFLKGSGKYTIARVTCTKLMGVRNVNYLRYLLHVHRPSIKKDKTSVIDCTSSDL